MRLFSLIHLLLFGCTSNPKSKQLNFDSLAVLDEANPTLPFRLGGFSGLCFLGIDGEGRYRFLTHTDRGPNGEPIKTKDGMSRAFLLPNFIPKLVEFSVDRGFNAPPRIIRVFPLKDATGQPLKGLPNDAHQVDGHKQPEETPIDAHNQVLAFDPAGIDPEGIALDPDGSYWMGEEYGPSILHFDAAGILLERFVPKSFSASTNTYTHAILPEIYRQRPTNRGFEAIVYNKGKVYAFLQSPIKSDVPNNTIRVLEFDTKKKLVTGEFLYPLADGTDHKIGDATVLGNGDFLVIENFKSAKEKKKQVNVARMTLPHDLTKVVKKSLFIDLTAAGYAKDKPEGLAIVPDNQLIVLNDNDFDVAHILSKKASDLQDVPNTLVIFDVPRL